MIWNNFFMFAIPSCLLWLAGSVSVYISKKKWITDIFLLSGSVLLSIFIFLLWQDLERPPLRTIGETRLWYAFFLSVIGFITYKRWNYQWLPSFCSLMSIIFIVINLFKPEIHSKTIMPALQSYWFIPHVTVYMLSYAVFGAATLAGCVQIFNIKTNKGIKPELMDFIDNVIYVGFAFLALGMLMGAIWAKEAWGHYWSWDPKETWAFITGSAYLAYIHIRLRNHHIKKALYFLPLAFVLLMIAWVGVNYLPSAQGSIHTYSRQN